MLRLTYLNTLMQLVNNVLKYTNAVSQDRVT